MHNHDRQDDDENSNNVDQDANDTGSSGDNNAKSKDKINDTDSEMIIGVCNNLKKKGKCRKGDKCRYSHDLSSFVDNNRADVSNDTFKRKRIDGKFLVEKRKQEGTKIIFNED